jgi:hypothetical protein
MRLVLALLLVSCGHHGPSASPGATGAAPAPGPIGALPSGPPLVTPGEHMVYRVQLGGVDLAQMTIGVDAPSELAGRRAIIVQGRVKSAGLASLVTTVDDTFTSWLDAATGRSLRFTVDELASKSASDVEHTVIDLAARAGDAVSVQFHLRDDAPTDEPQTLGAPEVWDFNSFLVMLRAWEGPKGTTASMEVFRSRYLWHVDMTIAGKTTLSTALGELPALRFDGHTYKLGRDHARFPDSEARAFSIWISDDDGRVPLQLVARTDYGDVKMSITDYQLDNGGRL